jgi:hypothetical protein
MLIELLLPVHLTCCFNWTVENSIGKETVEVVRSEFKGNKFGAEKTLVVGTNLTRSAVWCDDSMEHFIPFMYDISFSDSSIHINPFPLSTSILPRYVWSTPVTKII